MHCGFSSRCRLRRREVQTNNNERLKPVGPELGDEGSNGKMAKCGLLQSS